jgi:hypothetical protein
MPESPTTSRAVTATQPRVAKPTTQTRRRRSPKIQTVLDDELYVLLQARAVHERRSVSQTVRFMIEAALRPPASADDAT